MINIKISANIIFAKREKDVTIYPEQVSVKVALDTLEVMGCRQQIIYLVKNSERLVSPK